MVQTVDYQTGEAARGSPRTSHPQRGVSLGTASTQRWGALPQPFLAPGGWVGSDCLTRRNVANGSEWVPCCCGSDTADRSRRDLRGQPGGRGGYTAV